MGRLVFPLEHNSFDLENRISYRMTMVVRRIQATITAMVRSEYRLTLMGWRVMSIVGRFGPISAKEVRMHTAIPADQISRTVDDLVKRGWVARKRSSDDARRLSLTLLGPGKKMFKRTELMIRSLNNELVRGLKPTEQKAFQRTVLKLESHSRTMMKDPATAWRALVTLGRKSR